MNEFKHIVAKNITKLRTAHHMTQLELGERLSYTDKAVSKWERGESLPDVLVLKKISEIFEVSVDYLLNEHDDKETASFIQKISDHNISYRVVSLIAITGVWTLALLIFVICWWFDKIVWSIFIYTIPVTFILLLVFNSLWGKKKSLNYIIISGLVWSVLLVIYIGFLEFNLWQIALVGIPAELIIFLCTKLKKNHVK